MSEDCFREDFSNDELFFFAGKPAALPIYEAFRNGVLSGIPCVRTEVKKTQISFFSRHMFAAVSFTRSGERRTGRIHS